MASWKNREKAINVINAIRRWRRTRLEADPEMHSNRQSFAIGESDRYATALMSQVRLNDDIPDASKYHIIERLLYLIAEPDGPDYDELLNHFNGRESEFLSQNRPQVFVLVASLSLSIEQVLHHGDLEYDLDGTNILITGNVPDVYDMEVGRADAERLFDNPFPAGYSYAVIRVEARVANQAVDRAIAALDYLRGIWTLISRSGSGITFGSSRREPLGYYMLGPVYYLYNEQGEPFSKLDIYNNPLPMVVWYNGDFVTAKNPHKVNKWDNLMASERYVREAIEDSPCSDIFKESLSRLARALDEISYRNCLMRLWGVVETMTLTSNARYEQMIRRAVCTIDGVDAELTAHTLQTIREMRNSIVHADYDASYARGTIRALCDDINLIFRGFLGLSSRLDNIESFGEFLDLPRNVEVLRHRAALYEDALKYRTASSTANEEE